MSKKSLIRQLEKCVERALSIAREFDVEQQVIESGDAVFEGSLSHTSQNIDGSPGIEMLCDAIGLTSLAMVLVESGEGDDEYVFGLLSDAYMLIGGAGIFLIAEKQAGEFNPASELATRRHSKTYAMRDEVLKHWREHCTPDMSAQKAATKLARLGLVENEEGTLSHKTAAEVIAKARKKKPS